MPTYEYACSACGHEWDQVQRITEAPVELCPKCEKAGAHRLISRGTNFILKGGGWYSDLYSSSKPAEAKAAEGASGDGSGKVETKTDAKSDTKSDTSATPPAAAPAATTPASPSSTSS